MLDGCQYSIEYSEEEAEYTQKLDTKIRTSETDSHHFILLYLKIPIYLNFSRVVISEVLLQ